MNRTLPPAIVAALEQLGTELLTWAETHRDSPLAAQEQAVLTRVRATLPRLLGAVLRLSTRHLDPGHQRLSERCLRCGARWIWSVAAEHFSARRELVDFYHASEHLWQIARLLYGEGTPQAQAWGQARCHELRHAGSAPVRAALQKARATTPEGRRLLRRERGYFRTNAARMDYPAAQAAGLPIGSGAVESLARHLVQLRLKRPGARWAPAGAQAILTLRAHLQSGRPVLRLPAPTPATRPSRGAA